MKWVKVLIVLIIVWFVLLLTVVVMMLNTTFNDISIISWRLVLLVEETGIPGENHWPAVSDWQTVSHNVASMTLLTVSDYLFGIFKLNLIEIILTKKCSAMSRKSTGQNILLSQCLYQARRMRGKICMLGVSILPMGDSGNVSSNLISLRRNVPLWVASLRSRKFLRKSDLREITSNFLHIHN